MPRIAQVVRSERMWLASGVGVNPVSIAGGWWGSRLRTAATTAPAARLLGFFRLLRLLLRLGLRLRSVARPVQRATPRALTPEIRGRRVVPAGDAVAPASPAQPVFDVRP